MDPVTSGTGNSASASMFEPGTYTDRRRISASSLQNLFRWTSFFTRLHYRYFIIIYSVIVQNMTSNTPPRELTRRLKCQKQKYWQWCNSEKIFLNG